MQSAPGFLDQDFLLLNSFGQRLYHQFAAGLPIIDYHGHLSPADISTNRQFENLTRVWLAGDHYKWRAMRTLGVDERFITGNASDADKFAQWAYTVPYTLRNPLYHWSHLELQRYFGIDDLISPASAAAIYQKANALLNTKEYHVDGLLQKMKVEYIGTTDDPSDSLEYHQEISRQHRSYQVAPSFRPDQSLFIGSPTYTAYLNQLGASAGLSIDSYHDLVDALHRRIEHFHAVGCRIADHGLEHMPLHYGQDTPDQIFARWKAGQPISPLEQSSFQFHLLQDLCEQYHAHGWVQQFHLGAMRNNNSRMRDRLGPDTGYDSIGDFQQARSLAHFLDTLDKENKLTRTILYNLNPAYNEVFATMAGNFNDGSTKGKIQYGSAWWFLDQKDGMEKQLNTLSNLGLISTFIGMLTDSRSFMSFPRHEYFRRVLCNLIGRDVQQGELPADEAWLGKIVSDICYYNAKAYFGL